MDIERVSVLLAVDQDVILNAVATRYMQQRDDINRQQALATARDFLGKIFQLSITLESPSQRQREHFVAQKLYPKHEAIVETQTIKPAEPVNTQLWQTQLDDLDFEGFDDEWNADVEESDDYLVDQDFEYRFFNTCMAAFNISNPRTLIRIHNAITLLKGLHPELLNADETLKHYMLFTFWLKNTSQPASCKRLN